jgi:uncharacterized protein YkwD
MKCWSLLVLALSCLLPLTGGWAAVQEKSKFTLSADEQKLLQLTNDERKGKNLPPLKANPVLCQVARAHAANMVKQGKMEHNLDGKTPYDRIKGAGYKYALAGENLAVGDASQEEVMKAWMKSKIHRENILDGVFTEIGLGLAADAKGKVYYTQVFGTPLQ